MTGNGLCYYPRFVAAVVAMLLSLTLACVGTDGNEPAVLRALEKLHAQIEAAQDEEIYRNADAELRAAVTEEAFRDVLRNVREKLGRAERASVRQYSAVRMQDGATIVRVAYDTKFTKGDAIERLVWRIRDGTPVLAAYHVTPASTPSDSTQQ